MDYSKLFHDENDLSREAYLARMEEFSFKNMGRVEILMETIENIRLLQMAESRKNSNIVSFEEFVAEQGFTMSELETLMESVEFE